MGVVALFNLSVLTINLYQSLKAACQPDIPAVHGDAHAVSVVDIELADRLMAFIEDEEVGASYPEVPLSVVLEGP